MKYAVQEEFYVEQEFFVLNTSVDDVSDAFQHQTPNDSGFFSIVPVIFHVLELIVLFQLCILIKIIAMQNINAVTVNIIIIVILHAVAILGLIKAPRKEDKSINKF
jgi:hypothetical protein